MINTFTRFVVLDANDNNKINFNIDPDRYNVTLESYMFPDYVAIPDPETTDTEIIRDVISLNINGLQLGGGHYPLLIESSSFSKINAHYVECFVRNQQSYQLKLLSNNTNYVLTGNEKIVLIFQFTKA